MGDTGEATADWIRQPTLRIDVAVIRYGVRGPVYRVTYAGEVLLEGCRCPAFEACRALLAKGITGRLEVWRSGRLSADLQVEIERGAGYTIVETDKISLRLGPWVSWSDAISRVTGSARAAISSGVATTLPSEDEGVPEPGPVD